MHTFCSRCCWPAHRACCSICIVKGHDAYIPLLSMLCRSSDMYHNTQDALRHLQSPKFAIAVVCQGLSGVLPNFGYAIASKMSTLRISNTSLQQCDASQLAVYEPGLTDTTVKAGSSSQIPSDKMTGCLPDALLFCQAQEVGISQLYCPSVAFRRPVQTAPNQLTLVRSSILLLKNLSVLC